MKFGPDDRSTLDNKQQIVDNTRKLKDNLLSQYTKLEKMRYGDVHEHVPVSRADGFWPFLLIRSFPGDVGARPIPTPAASSPDIILASGNPQYQPTIVGRDDIAGFLSQNAIIRQLTMPVRVAVWVHVWNLGRAPAHGVRVRAWCSLPGVGFIGGRAFDLGDRTSSTSHLMVKVGSFVIPANLNSLRVDAAAECMSDVAGAVRDPGRDRHRAACNLSR
jgi:hypothetical protein